MTNPPSEDVVQAFGGNTKPILLTGGEGESYKVGDTVLKPVQYVVENSKFVSINEEKIEEFVKDYKPVHTEHWRTACPFEYRDFEGFRDEIDYRFLVDSQAFCFWGFPNKWTTTYQDLELDGWWAMLASFKRAHEKGLPIFEGRWLANLTLDDVRELFEGKPEIP